MFASQLLRILQTLPADVKYEPCAFETGELKVRMKENQNGIQRLSDGYREEPDSSSFTTKHLRHSHGHGKDADPLALQTREGDNFWNTPELERSAVVDDFTKNSENDIGVSSAKEQSGLFYHLSGCKKDADPLTSDKKDRDKLWNTPKLECSMMMNNFANINKHETRDSGALVVTSSEFPADTHLYTDKNVMECELPELIVCYKEINYHVVKDICIDEGMPVKGKGLTDLHSADHAGLCGSQPSKEYRQNETSGSLDLTLLIPDGSKASLEEDIDDHAADNGGTKEEGDIVSLVPGKLNCSMEVSVNKDGRNPEDLMQAGEMKCTPNKIENDVSEEESIVTSMLPLKEFGTRSFLRSFMDSLKNDRDEVAQQPNQSPSMEATLESFDAVSKAEESNKNGPRNKLVYNSKVENGTITFDFNSPNPAAADSLGRSAETVEQALKSDDVLNHNNGNIGNLAANLVQHAGQDGSTVNVNHQSILKNRNSSNPFTISEVQSTSMDGSTKNIHQETVLNHNNGNSNNPFAIGEVQSAITDGSTGNIDQISVLNYNKGNFNPFAFSEIGTASIDTSTENIHQPPMLNAKKGSSNNPFAASEVQNASMDESSGNIHQQPALSHKMGKTTNPFAVTEVQSSCMTGSIENTHQQPELKHKSGNSNNPFAIKEVRNARMDGSSGNIHENPLKSDEMPDHRDGTDKSLSATDKRLSAETVHEQSFVPQDLPNNEGTTNNLPFTDQGEGGDGEASFSAAGPVSGLITYSGPITYSGSTSLRSDSSTTSTRSFAFPVLQSEWNSSPVRMGKADGRHFRKHRGWKQGAWRALCCSGRFIG